MNNSYDDSKTPTCPKCGGMMQLRTGKSGYKFYGCCKFPRCKGTVKYLYTSTKIEKIGRTPIAKPSDRQNNIWKAIRDSKCSLQVNAVAGSGKTTTIIEGLYLLPSTLKIAFLVFDKKTADRTAAKVPEWVKCCTTHSLGFQNIKRSGLKPNPIVEEDKTKLCLQSVLTDYGLTKECDQYKIIMSNFGMIKSVVNLMKDLLMQGTEEQIKELCQKFGFNPTMDMPDFIQVAQDTFYTSVEDRTRIDFEDMILWNVIYDDVSVEKFDVILVDEQQDQNKLQMSFIRKSLNDNGRVITVGDPFQSIYAFRGADSGAMDIMRNLFDSEVYPLDITYRCPKSVVSLVNQEFPEINFYASPNAIEGEVNNISYDMFLENIKVNDLVLCRNNAPLVKPCFTLIRNGVKANIMGRDIGKGLKDLMSRISKKYDVTSIDEILESLETFLEEEDEKALRRKIDNSEMHDKVDTLRALSEDANSLQDVLDNIDSLFSDDCDGVVFSTVHRSKGSEADNVYILEPGLLEGLKATTDEQKQQERNLKYVAYTRPKFSLNFIC